MVVLTHVFHLHIDGLLIGPVSEHVRTGSFRPNVPECCRNPLYLVRASKRLYPRTTMTYAEPVAVAFQEEE